MADVIQDLEHLNKLAKEEIIIAIPLASKQTRIMLESRMQGQPACPVWRGLGRNVSQQWDDRAPLPPYITYVRMKQGWMYLVAILDWFSRYVVSWELDQSLELPFVLRAVDRALAQAKPLICNSDQGGHFTSPQYLDRLRPFDIQISMDGRGRALDNIFTERLWRSVKYEEVYLVRREVATMFVTLKQSSCNLVFCHQYSTRTCDWSNRTV
jgi:transposase InsO family protein